jgi:hypothetical protein
VADGSDTEFEVDLAEPVREAVLSPEIEELLVKSRAQESAGPIWPWIVTGLGVAAVGVAIYVDQTEVKDLKNLPLIEVDPETTPQMLEDAENSAIAWGITGAVLTGVGVVALFVYSQNEEASGEGDEDHSELSLRISPLGIDGRLRW